MPPPPEIEFLGLKHQFPNAAKHAISAIKVQPLIIFKGILMLIRLVQITPSSFCGSFRFFFDLFIANNLCLIHIVIFMIYLYIKLKYEMYNMSYLPFLPFLYRLKDLCLNTIIVFKKKRRSNKQQSYQCNKSGDVL